MDEPQAALMVKSRRFSLIWIIPLVALIAAGWLGWRSYASEGPRITISFESATGLEAGRTQIKYKDIVLGTVESVVPTKDLSHVIVTARMGSAAEPYLAEGAYFWVVRPSLSARDLSGLGTFISGPYIGFEPGKGKPLRSFTGEQSPDFIPAEEPGQIYTLHATQLGSISQGSAIYFHGMKVGRVLGYTLSDQDGSATVRLIVDAPHDALVHAGTKFWNTSGISVAVGANGLQINLESIQSLLVGGVAFDVPAGTDAGPIANATTVFTLYPNESSAQDSIYTQRIHFLLHFAQSVPGLAVGSPVRLQGIMVGQVSELNIDYDSSANRITIPVTIEVEADRLKLNTDIGYEAFRKLVASGLRARLGSGNLLTGQKVINLEFAANAPPASMIEGGAYPEIPVTDADDIDAIMRSTKELLTKLQSSAGNLDKTLKQADTALSSDNGGGDLAGTLSEVKNAARSVRVLTDYLDNHPEAVLKGKPKDAP